MPLASEQHLTSRSRFWGIGILAEKWVEDNRQFDQLERAVAHLIARHPLLMTFLMSSSKTECIGWKSQSPIIGAYSFAL